PIARVTRAAISGGSRSPSPGSALPSITSPRASRSRQRTLPSLARRVSVISRCWSFRSAVSWRTPRCASSSLCARSQFSSGDPADPLSDSSYARSRIASSSRSSKNGSLIRISFARTGCPLRQPRLRVHDRRLASEPLPREAVGEDGHEVRESGLVDEPLEDVVARRDDPVVGYLPGELAARSHSCRTDSGATAVVMVTPFSIAAYGVTIAHPRLARPPARRRRRVGRNYGRLQAAQCSRVGAAPAHLLSSPPRRRSNDRIPAMPASPAVVSASLPPRRCEAGPRDRRELERRIGGGASRDRREPGADLRAPTRARCRPAAL